MVRLDPTMTIADVIGKAIEVLQNAQRNAESYTGATVSVRPEQRYLNVSVDLEYAQENPEDKEILGSASAVEEARREAEEHLRRHSRTEPIISIVPDYAWDRPGTAHLDRIGSDSETPSTRAVGSDEQAGARPKDDKARAKRNEHS